MKIRLDLITTLLRERGLKKGAFAESLGMSRQNLDQIIRKNRITNDRLEQIARALEVPVTFFYETDENSASEIGIPKSSKEKDSEIDFLREQLKEKTDYIKLLNEKISLLEEKVNKYEPK